MPASAAPPLAARVAPRATAVATPAGRLRIALGVARDTGRGLLKYVLNHNPTPSPKRQYWASVMRPPPGGRGRADIIRSSQMNREELGLVVREAARQGISPSDILVINLQLENPGEMRVVESLGMRALHINMIDHTIPLTMRPLKKVLAAVQDPKNKLVVIHCAAGRGRTGMAVAAIQIALDGVSTEDAIAEMERYASPKPSRNWYIRRFAKAWREGRIDPGSR